ncbi:outer dense fiber protein 2-like isoform X2 [Homalodisca vitripennis]|uniref:outer dense fiber protein 2-like isoform X2 n=1 Tax=Homalodisca vitripennis TaxID=197043 RepID=UPI001EEA166C|nr:outer dense fiber protein 2-like isoform X2 [Homalodisca vitripennis]
MRRAQESLLGANDAAPADEAAEGEEESAAPAAEDEGEAEPTGEEPPAAGDEGGDEQQEEEGQKEDEGMTEDAAKEKDKKKETKKLFDSKGSLLETESFVREKLEEFKQKRAAVAVLIGDLQGKVKEYKEKENPTDDDIANLKKYHAAFLEKLGEYEDMTRSLERLMGMADVPTSQLDMTMSGPPFSKPAKLETPAPEKQPELSVLDTDLEDKLPKLIVCGTDMGDNVPRIIVCEPLKRADLEPFSKSSGGVGSVGEGAGVIQKLNKCLETQQELAAENAEMAKMRHQLQQELLDKQDMLDCMKQKMMTMECEKYRIQSENCELQKRLIMSQKPGDPPMCKRELYMKLRGTSPDACPMGGNKDLEQELEKMGGDVKNIYSELECMQKEKLALGYSTSVKKRDENLSKADEEAKKIGFDGEGMQKIPSTSEVGHLSYMEEKINACCGDTNNMYPEGVCMMERFNFGGSGSPRKPVCKRMLPQKSTQTDADKEKDILFATDKDPKMKDLREQYQRLHSDFKNKVTEVASVRVDLEKTKKELDAITILHHELEAIHQKTLDENTALMAEKNQMQELKDKMNDLEQQANVAKQMYKTGQEEMEEMRLLIEEQATQLDDYRNKYMKTLQIAEELKKENEFKERECADQIAVEIQKVKLEMQEQLEELSPIKDLLRITQQKLKETEQMHNIALETIADITKKLENANNEVDTLRKKVDSAKTDGDLNINLMNSLENADKKLNAMENENAHLKGMVGQLEGLQVNQAQKLEEKSHELLQMTQQLETLREESARQVARVKERSEMIRKCLQAQIGEMEREVATCRAATAFANRERDEVS